MDLNTLSTAAADESGVDFSPLHPATREPLDMTIRLRSANCDSVRAKSRAFARRLQLSPEFRKAGVIDIDQAEAQGTERLVACTVSWDGVVYNGVTLPCNAENARRIYSDAGLSWLRDQVREFVEDQTNFLPKTANGSTVTPNACSSSPAPMTTAPASPST